MGVGNRSPMERRSLAWSKIIPLGFFKGRCGWEHTSKREGNTNYIWETTKLNHCFLLLIRLSDTFKEKGYVIQANYLIKKEEPCQYLGVGFQIEK